MSHLCLKRGNFSMRIRRSEKQLLKIWESLQFPAVGKNCFFNIGSWIKHDAEHARWARTEIRLQNTESDSAHILKLRRRGEPQVTTRNLECVRFEFWTQDETEDAVVTSWVQWYNAIDDKEKQVEWGGVGRKRLVESALWIFYEWCDFNIRCTCRHTPVSQTQS